MASSVTINQLEEKDQTLVEGDSFIIWDSQSTSTKRITFSTLLEAIQNVINDSIGVFDVTIDGESQQLTTLDDIVSYLMQGARVGEENTEESNNTNEPENTDPNTENG